MIEVKWATEENVHDYYNGNYPNRTFRGVAIVEDGKTIVLGGVYRDKVNMIAFSDFKVDATKYKKHVVKATRMVVSTLGMYNHVYAIIGETSPPGAREYIEHFGFVRHPHPGYKDVFIWRNKYGND